MTSGVIALKLSRRSPPGCTPVVNASHPASQNWSAVMCAWMRVGVRVKGESEAEAEAEGEGEAEGEAGGRGDANLDAPEARAAVVAGVRLLVVVDVSVDQEDLGEGEYERDRQREACDSSSTRAPIGRTQWCRWRCEAPVDAVRGRKVWK